MKIRAKVDRFENGHAVFSSDYGEITLPRQALPKKYTEGMMGTLSFGFAGKEDEAELAEKNAKELLNELLDNEGEE